MKLKVLLLIPALLLFAFGDSERVTFSDCDLSHCGTELTELKSNLAEIKRDPVQPLKFLKESHQQCGRTLDCLKSLDCTDGAKFVDVTSNTCDGLLAMTGDLQGCVEKFYSAVYHRKYKCVEDNQYLTKNLTKKYIAFTNGSACFEGVIRYECPNISLRFIRNNKDLVLKLITEKPRASCGIFYELQALECKPIMNRLLESFGESRDNVIEQVHLCSDMETCISGNDCHYTTQQHKNVSESCKLLEVQTTPMTRCFQKLRNHSELINWSASCLEGSDFFDTSKQASCDRLQGKKECVKQIIADFCGQTALESYEAQESALLTIYNCPV